MRSAIRCRCGRCRCRFRLTRPHRWTLRFGRLVAVGLRCDGCRRCDRFLRHRRRTGQPETVGGGKRWAGSAPGGRIGHEGGFSGRSAANAAGGHDGQNDGENDRTGNGCRGLHCEWWNDWLWIARMLDNESNVCSPLDCRFGTVHSGRSVVIT